MSSPHNSHDGSRYIFTQKMKAGGFLERFVNFYHSGWHRVLQTFKLYMAAELEQIQGAQDPLSEMHT
jgi:hypothetical protein